MTSLRDNLFLLARLNDDKGIEKLFIRGSRELDERDDNGLTALHICATYGCVEACAILLKFGAKHSLQDFESGWTPLHRAFYFGNLRVSLLLIRAGAMIADEGETRDWRTGVCSRRERWRSIRNLASWKANIDHDGLSPLDLLSLSLGENLSRSKRELLCTSVFSFGKADFTLGVPLPNSVENILHPRRIEHLSCESIIQIVASRFHSVALTREGEVYSWGHGRAGRLGLGDENTQPEPRLISSLCGFMVRMISAGVNHTLAITNAGDIFSWGSDRFGQLGYGGGDAGKGSLSPRKIDSLKKSVVVAIAAGDAHSVCFTNDGEIYSWGCNKDGQLGVPLLERGGGMGGGSGSSIPKRVHLKGSKMTVQSGRENKFEARKIHCSLLQIVASKSSTLLLRRPDEYDSSKGKGRFLTQVNEVYQWGHGSHIPSRVMFNRGAVTTAGGADSAMDRFFGHHTVAPIDIVQLSAGQYHNVALSSMGHVYTWGLGSDQLGHGSQENRLSIPQLLETLLPENGGGKVVMVSAAVDRTCVVSDVGDLYTWGATSAKGILGLGSGLYQPIPKLIGGIKRAVSVAAGSDYTLVLTSATVPAMPFSDAQSDALPNAMGNALTRGKNAKGSLVVIPGSKGSTSRNGLTTYGVMDYQSSSSESSDTSDHDSSSEEDNDEEEEEDAESESDVEEEEEEDSESDEEQDGIDDDETDPVGSDMQNLHTKRCAKPLKQVISASPVAHILSLQELCEQRIAGSVDCKNVVTLLAHAESIGAKALTAFCTQFIHRNLDAILVQSRPADLDILIADLGSLDIPPIPRSDSVSKPLNALGSSSATSSSGIKAAAGVTIGSSVRSGLTRKLSKEDLEWHSRDAKHLSVGYGMGMKCDGRERESSWSGRGSMCDEYGKRQDPYSETSSKADYMNDDLRHLYGHDERDDMGRGRSHSKDYDSLSGVIKQIRSVKKKLLSIAELDGRNVKDGSEVLNDEQKDKISRKEAYTCELKRLKLICTRLEGEERVKIAAKLLRDKATPLSGESNKQGVESLVTNERPTATSTVVSDDLPSPIGVAMTMTMSAPDTPVCVDSKSDVRAKNVRLESNCTSATSSSVLAIKSAAGQHAGVTTASSNNATNVPTVTPSYVDWLQVTRTLDPSDSIPVPIGTNQEPLHAVSSKAAWGNIPVKSVQPSVSFAASTTSRQSIAATVGTISISHMSASGQTVLSPYVSKGSSSASTYSSSNITSMIPSMSTTSVLTRPEKCLNGLTTTRQPSAELSLADLIITPKKKNKQSSVDSAPPTPNDATTKKDLTCAPFCPWLSPSSQANLTSATSLKGESPDKLKLNSVSKSKPKSLHEIQFEEESARLQSNISSLKGNDNPWYQERRKRADSIEAVIRSQVEEKALELVIRTDEENAVREVDLFKRREKREKMKTAKNMHNAKQNAKMNDSSKGDLSATPSHETVTATGKGAANAQPRLDNRRGRGGRGRGGDKSRDTPVATDTPAAPTPTGSTASLECAPSSSASSDQNLAVTASGRKPRGGRGARNGKGKEESTSEARATPNIARTARSTGEKNTRGEESGRDRERGRGNAGHAERSAPSSNTSAAVPTGAS